MFFCVFCFFWFYADSIFGIRFNPSSICMICIGGSKPAVIFFTGPRFLAANLDLRRSNWVTYLVVWWSFYFLKFHQIPLPSFAEANSSSVKCNGWGWDCAIHWYIQTAEEIPTHHGVLLILLACCLNNYRNNRYLYCSPWLWPWGGVLFVWVLVLRFYYHVSLEKG